MERELDVGEYKKVVEGRERRTGRTVRGMESASCGGRE